MMRWVAGACTMILASSPLLAKDPGARPVYCTQGPKGDWSLHRFKPLIRVQGGTVFAEMSFAGPVLVEVKLRRFYSDSELAFDYLFDASGRLTELHGSVTVKSVPPPGADPGTGFELADWLGEADLSPAATERFRRTTSTIVARRTASTSPKMRTNTLGDSIKRPYMGPSRACPVRPC